MNANWAEMMNQFQGQGSIFWVAAASIAGGATLLLISGLILARRGLTGSWLKGWRRGRPTVVLTETGYRAQTLTKAPAAAAPEVTEGEQVLGDLYLRLRTAGNQLEEIRRSLKNADQMQGVSRLKAPLREVEYVFKSGIS